MRSPLRTGVLVATALLLLAFAAVSVSAANQFMDFEKQVKTTTKSFTKNLNKLLVDFEMAPKADPQALRKRFEEESAKRANEIGDKLIEYGEKLTSLLRLIAPDDAPVNPEAEERPAKMACPPLDRAVQELIKAVPFYNTVQQPADKINKGLQVIGYGVMHLLVDCRDHMQLLELVLATDRLAKRYIDQIEATDPVAEDVKALWVDLREHAVSYITTTNFDGDAPDEAAESTPEKDEERMRLAALGEMLENRAEFTDQEVATSEVVAKLLRVIYPTSAGAAKDEL